MTPDQRARLEDLERQARERGFDVDHSGRYVFDPDAELDAAELVDDVHGGLTDAEREQCRQLEAKHRAKWLERCDVCALPLAAGQSRRHHSCAATCQDCYRPATNCQCSATVRRRRQAATA